MVRDDAAQTAPPVATLRTVAKGTSRNPQEVLRGTTRQRSSDVVWVHRFCALPFLEALEDHLHSCCRLVMEYALQMHGRDGLSAVVRAFLSNSISAHGCGAL